MSGNKWISEGAEQLFCELEGHTSGAPHFDIAIVGSGYGGAVAAARLAGLVNKKNEPLKVCVLERGREFVPGTFPDKFSDLPGQVRLQGDKVAHPRGVLDGLFDFRLGSNVSTLLGNGLGGGSLINAGVLVQPDDTLMNNKRWPALVRNADLQDYFDKARHMLQASRIPDPKLDKLAALEAVAQELGDDAPDHRADIAVSFAAGTNPIGVDQKECVRCGDCFTGCNHWAKNTLAMNYLPFARRRGARLFSGVTVLSVKPSYDRKGWALRLELTDPDTQKRLRPSPLNASNPAPPIILLAHRVILAAGTFGSTEILMRSRSKGFALSETLGERFSTNGDMIAIGHNTQLKVNASADPKIPPDCRLVGPTIAGIIDFRTSQDPEKRGIVIEELAIPAALRRIFEETITTFGGLHGLIERERSDHSPDDTGPDPAGISQAATMRTAVYAIMGDDEAKGRLELLHSEDGERSDDQGVRVVWENVAKQPVFDRAMRTLREAHASSRIGGIVVPYPAWRALPDQIESIFGNPAGKGAVFTVHPLGGCAMADSHNEGVVNHIGQVFNPASAGVYGGLVVLDGSTIPCSLGINPCLTIAALAEYAVEHLRAEWGLHYPVNDSLQPLPVPPQISRPHVRPRPTGIRLAEKMKGRNLVFPSQGGGSIPAAGELVFEFDEIKDLSALIAHLPKVIRIAKGTLRVEPSGAPPAVVPVSGQMSFLERERSTSTQRICRALWAWVRNRGVRELWILAVLKLRAARIWAQSRRTRRYMKFLARNRPAISSCAKIQAFIALASHVGEARRFVYRLETQNDLSISGQVVLPKGARLIGEKRLAYTFHGNPWIQLSRLKLHLECPDTGELTEIGTLELDPVHFVKEHAVQLQLLSQETQPDAIADLVSFSMFFIRLVGTIHLWTFRAPDYPRPYPDYSSVPGGPPHVKRLPGKVPGASRTGPFRVGVPTTIELPFPFFENGEFTIIYIPLELGEAMPIYLTRYHARKSDPQAAPLEPVVMFHGYGAAGNTFTPNDGKNSLVQNLVEKGFDVWVVDFRTSIALSSSLQNWIFEQIAYGDVCAAIEHVRNETRAVRVNVVAHCVGAAMFSMAVLGGRLPAEWINSVVLSQVGPLVDLPALNSTRGYFAGYLKYLLNWRKLDVTSSLTPLVRFIDRLLAAYPYPDHELSVHHPVWPWAKFTHEVYCNRTHAIFGRLFEHANLDEATLDDLHTLLGNVNLQTFLQTTFYATRGRITDFLGRNVYVTYDNVAKSYCFPVCIVHGVRNEVFSVSGAERSINLLHRVFGDHPNCLRFVPIPGYGHQDCLIGKNAHSDVFHHIVEFLKDNINAPRLQPLPSGRDVVREPVLGPVLGWIRSVSSDQISAFTHRANIMFVPDDSTSPPLYAMTFVLKVPQGNNQPAPVPGFAKYHQLNTVTPGLASDVGRLNTKSAEVATVAQNIEVELPAGMQECLILVITVHREPDGNNSGGRPDRMIKYQKDGTRLPDKVDTRFLDNDEQNLFVGPILNGCKDLCGNAMRFCMETRVIDEGYESRPGVAVISRDCLAAAGPDSAANPHFRREQEVTGELVFATGSCRYAASIFDRELADRSFERLVTLLRARPAGRFTPQFLILTGDQIYADATAGLFDPTTGLERFDHRYLEAWSAPHAREVLRRLPTYMMLDDHEIEENWEKNPSFERDGLSAFAQYQRKLAPPNPNFANDKKPPFWYSFSSYGYGFFVTDTRSERRRHGALDRLSDRIFSDLQMQVLLDWLRCQNDGDAGSRPKFVVSSSVLAPWTKSSGGASAYALREDGWVGFPTSMNTLLGVIAQEQIRNVVFLSGDYHSSMVCEIEVSAGAKSAPVKVFSIVSSGFYSPYPFANMPDYDLQLNYVGTQHGWIGQPIVPPHQWVDLRIRYATQNFLREDGFAVVRVAPANLAGHWTIFIEFDTASRTVGTTLAL